MISAAFHEEMTRWRRELHAHPETAFEEHWTSDYIARKLEGFGLAVHRGLAGTGVVATLKGLRDGPSIGLRADMDALDIREETGLPYSSAIGGKMHACGHDGHMAMLLGAARRLAENPDFAGTAHFIFQPAEENEGGGRVMVEQGLFDLFPVASVHGIHNWPNSPFGTFLGRPGAIMASYDIFEIEIVGRAAHGAMPDRGIDPIIVATQIVGALQTIVSRSVDPLQSAVVSVTKIYGGEAWNVIPSETVIGGTVRTFSGDVQTLIEQRIRAIAENICRAHGAECRLRYERRYPVTVNSDAALIQAYRAAEATVGSEKVVRDAEPSMASEDFAFMLNARPGSYIFLGSGEGPDLHSSFYDFNDELLPIGARYWINLVKASA